MNCAEVQRLLHLNRPGERTLDEDVQVRRHCETCTACSREAELIALSHELFERARTSPIISFNSDLASARAIAALKINHRRAGIFERIVVLTDLKGARLAYGIAVGLIVAGFVFQIPKPATEAAPITASSFVSYDVDPVVSSLLRQAVNGPSARILGTEHDRIEIRKDDLHRMITIGEQQLIQMSGLRPQDQRHIGNIIRKLMGTLTVSIRLQA